MTEKWSQLGATLWDESVPIAGTPAEAYLRGRGITRSPGPEVLRFHPAVQHPKLKRKLPALIAQVTGGVEPSHNFTWLSADGAGKADTEKAEQRRTLGSSKGGAVRLAEPIDGKPLIVGEGIETTATAMEATGLPGWASLGTSGLGNIEWPGDVREVILLAENDENNANQRALDKVCPVLAEQGLKVRVASPPAGFGDFNDLVDPRKEGGGPGGLVIAKMIIEAAPEWRPKRGASPKPKEKTERNSQASFLVELAAERCELFTDFAGRSLRRVSRRARRGRAASRDPQRQVARFQPVVEASFLRRARRLAVQRRDVERAQDHRSKSALRRRPARGLLALSELG